MTDEESDFFQPVGVMIVHHFGRWAMNVSTDDETEMFDTKRAALLAAADRLRKLAND